MAAPSLIDQTSGATDAAAPATIGVSELDALVANDVIIAQIVQDGTTAGITATFGSSSGVTNLAGTADAVTHIGTFNVGNPAVALQHLYIGRSTGSGAPGATFNIDGYGADDIYVRLYGFRDVNTGTTLSAVIENSTAGTATGAAGTSATIADVGVTTLGPDRLALNFVGGSDDNALDAFTGMSGGTWAEAVAEYATATGTDAVLGLQSASMASAGTIDGGTDGWADGTDGWGVVGFALIGTTVASSPSFVLPNPSLRLVRSRQRPR